MLSLSLRDKQIIWHPFTQEKVAGLPIAVKSARGSYIYDENNKSYLDLISSWWVNLHGHAHPEIAKSIYDQALKLEHVIFAGFTHTPAVTLCENLKALLPAELKRFFFSDNGSTAVEIALKMAYQYWYNQDQREKAVFLCFEGGYHGDTFGSMAVSYKSGFHNIFHDLLFKVIALPYPSTWNNDQEILSKENDALLVLERYLESFSNKIAALVVEPLIQGASGMRICRPEFMAAVLKRVREYNILIIFDEVMTGFGRTGSHFALDQIEIVPDFLCLSKGITGGFLPLALTVTTENIYQAFLHDETKYAFAHGHSYTANPLACAAAVTSLELLLKQSTQRAIESINAAHWDGITELKDSCMNVERLRVLGAISAFEIRNTSSITSKLAANFLSKGLLIRPLNNVIYLLPPYSITTQELKAVYQEIIVIIKELGI